MSGPGDAPVGYWKDLVQGVAGVRPLTGSALDPVQGGDGHGRGLSVSRICPFGGPAGVRSVTAKVRGCTDLIDGP